MLVGYFGTLKYPNIMTIQILKNFTRLNKIFVTSNKTPIYIFYLIPTLKIE